MNGADPGTVLVAVSSASALVSAGAYVFHHRARCALDRLSARDIGGHLRAAFAEPLRELLPESISELLDKLPATETSDGTVAAPGSTEDVGANRAAAPGAAGEPPRDG